MQRNPDDLWWIRYYGPSTTGRTIYVTNPSFPDPEAPAFEQVCRLIALCCLPLASSYRAFLPFHPGNVERTGVIPHEPTGHPHLVDDLYAWRTTHPIEKDDSPSNFFAFIALLDGDEFVFRDEFAPVLRLTPDEFRRVQKCWQAHGLPADLFVEASTVPARRYEERAIMIQTRRYLERLLRDRFAQGYPGAVLDHAGQPLPLVLANVVNALSTVRYSVDVLILDAAYHQLHARLRDELLILLDVAHLVTSRLLQDSTSTPPIEVRLQWDLEALATDATA